MKVLVTGANGYIGQGVSKALVQNKVNAVATDFDVNHVCDGLEKMPGNIFEIENPYEYFGKPDILLHLAWRDGFKHNSENHILDLSAHYEFIKKMIDAGVKRVCIMGSMHEIGFYEGSIDEDTPCNPMSLYGIAKNTLRSAVQLYAKEKNVEFIWLRGYYIVGNTEYGCSIFSKITEAVKEGKTEFPFTTGQSQYDFLDYDIFCEQVVKAAVQNEELGIINCCSGYPQKLADVVEKFIAGMGYNIVLKYGVFPERAYDSKAVWGDASKIKRIMSKGKNE